MAFSRRMFLRHGVLTAAACASTPLMALGRARTISNDDEGGPERNLSSSSNSNKWQDHATALDHLGRNAFSGALGTHFKVFLPAADSMPVWVTLFAVEDLPALAPTNPASFAVPNKATGVAPVTSGFMLVFGGSSPLPQGTHLFEHQNLGRFAMFTVPDGNGQQTHTAVINLLQGAPAIAIPYGKGHIQSQGVGAALGAVKPLAATSSADEVPSHGPSESQGARRVAAMD
ncbi:MAG TPA: hypothetical protein VGJ33_21295 [Candidatus Angelobacter sp.]